MIALKTPFSCEVKRKWNSGMKISGTGFMPVNFMDDLLFVRMTKANNRCVGNFLLSVKIQF